MTTYHSETEITINVRLHGQKRHLRFMPTTMGDSHFSTDDSDLQQAIERHPCYGSLFHRQMEQPQPAQPSVAIRETPRNQPVHIPFTDISEAKEELAERLGVSRTSMRSLHDIAELAHKHHIIFDGFPAL